MKEFLKSKPFVNGISDNEEVFNGAGCCVAQFIAHFKTKAGNLYMTTFDDVEEYNYTVNFLHSEKAYVVDRIELSVTNWEEKDIPEYAETLIWTKVLHKKTRTKTTTTTKTTKTTTLRIKV